MANVKISALPAGAALAGTEVSPFVQSAATVKVTASQLGSYILGGVFDVDFNWNPTTNTLSLGSLAVPATIQPPLANNANGASIGLIAADGNGTNKNGGSLTLNAGNSTGSGTAGSLFMDAKHALFFEIDGGATATFSSGGAAAVFNFGIDQYNFNAHLGGTPDFTVGGSFNVDAATSTMNINSGFALTNFSVETLTTGFTFTVANDQPVLVIDAAGTLATGTINLPATPTHGFIVEVSSTQTITALTVSGNGHTIKNAPTTLLAGGGFSYRYDESVTTWFKRY